MLKTFPDLEFSITNFTENVNIKPITNLESFLIVFPLLLKYNMNHLSLGPHSLQVRLNFVFTMLSEGVHFMRFQYSYWISFFLPFFSILRPKSTWSSATTNPLSFLFLEHTNTKMFLQHSSAQTHSYKIWITVSFHAFLAFQYTFFLPSIHTMTTKVPTL